MAEYTVPTFIEKVSKATIVMETSLKDIEALIGEIGKEALYYGIENFRDLTLGQLNIEISRRKFLQSK